MKKLCSLLFSIMVLLNMVPAALAQSVTLAELKEQAPQRLQMTVSTNAGGTVEVDAPVVLPDTDDLPVILCNSQLFDMTAVDEIYPLKKGTGSYEQFHNSDVSDHEGFVFCAKESQSYLLNGKTDTTGRYPLPMGATPPENALTLEEALALILENNRLFGGDPEVDLRVENAAAMSGLCKMKSAKVTDESTGVSFRGIMADPNQPVKGKERGLWEIATAQYLYGARVLGGRSHQNIAKLGNKEVWKIEPTRGRNLIMDKDNFSLLFQYLKEQRTLSETAALADWQTVESGIRKLIEDGQLKSVYQVELAYIVKMSKANCEELLSEEAFSHGQEAFEKWRAEVDHVLVPGWVIKGYALNRRNAKYFAASNSPDREAILMNGIGDRWFQDNYTLYLNGDDATALSPEDLVYDLEDEAQQK